jgi:glycosyltransferase involved in cell wall biosynthesis
MPTLNIASNTRWFEDQVFNGITLKCDTITDIRKDFRKIANSDVILINIGDKLLIQLCLLKIFFPFLHYKIISLDLILSKPNGVVDIQVNLKKLILKKVDFFILYMRDVTGYVKHYGLNPEKIIYLPFKINGYPEILDKEIIDEKYIFTGGVSKRDYVSFFKAVESFPYNTKLLVPPNELSSFHGTKIDYHNIPKNIEIIHDDGGHDSWVDYISRSRMVVLPIEKETISPSGISTYLVAMALKKCVIISEGPATRDLLPEGAAIIVPPADHASLGEAIARVYEDAELRESVAMKGYDYATSLQGKQRLKSDLVSFIVEKVGAGSRVPSPGSRVAGIEP